MLCLPNRIQNYSYNYGFQSDTHSSYPNHSSAKGTRQASGCNVTRGLAASFLVHWAARVRTSLPGGSPEEILTWISLTSRTKLRPWAVLPEVCLPLDLSMVVCLSFGHTSSVTSGAHTELLQRVPPVPLSPSSVLVTQTSRKQKTGSTWL